MRAVFHVWHALSMVIHNPMTASRPKFLVIVRAQPHLLDTKYKNYYVPMLARVRQRCYDKFQRIYA